jgi:hypothetical protein
LAKNGPRPRITFIGAIAEEDNGSVEQAGSVNLDPVAGMAILNGRIQFDRVRGCVSAGHIHLRGKCSRTGYERQTETAGSKGNPKLAHKFLPQFAVYPEVT